MNASKRQTGWLHHDGNIELLQAQISDYYKRSVPFRVYHGSTNITRVLSFKRSELVDTSKLTQVLQIDPETRKAWAESNVSMEKLLKATLRYGLMPPIVTEFPKMTIGGALQGGAIESSSFKWGDFSQTITKLEIILGNGSKIIASPTENSDLFYGTMGSYGSLGLVTAVEIKLIAAKKYVTVTTIPAKDFLDSLKLSRIHEKQCDYIEHGSMQRGICGIVVGNLSNEIAGKLKRFSQPWNTWYYLFIKKCSQAQSPVTFTTPLKDYIFRFNRGAFWAAEFAFKQAGIPFNGFTRLLLDPFLRTHKLYQAVQASAAGQRYLCQDIAVPEEAIEPFMNYIDDLFHSFPIGFCTVPRNTKSPLLYNYLKDTARVCSVGVYGSRIEPYEEFIRVNKAIESKVKRFGGRKWLYAHSYYSEKEFWQIYDKQWYDQVRKKYYATTLPDIYTRTRVNKTYSLNSKKAALRTILGLAKLRISD